MRHVVCLIVCLFACAAASDAATRTVCASGCQYTNLQTAIDEAVPGDTILLRAGETYVGNFKLRAKSASTSYITIKSDAPASSLPAAGVRLVPAGKPGGNTQRSALARLLGKGDTYKSTPVIRTDSGAHHYRLQFLEIDGAANVGYETLISVGANDSSQTTTAQAPASIVFDRVWAHGHPTKGMKRALAINGRSIEVLNSYLEDIFSLSDSQAVGAFNAPGPIRIINNFLEAAGENVLVGGADPRIPNLVPSDIEIRGNHFYKDPAWRTEVLSTPGRVSARAATGGSLASGTHHFSVAAVLTSGGANLVSAVSPQVSATVSARGAAVVSWSAVKNAEKYRVYRAASGGAATVYLETTSTSITYTGLSEKTGTPKTSGTRWTFKNHLELKNARRVTIDGNLFENNWSGFQTGYAILFTPKNQDGTAPWTAVQDVVFSNNVLRRSASGINISGEDWRRVTEKTRNIKIVNNVFDDISTRHGGKGAFLLMASGPRDVVIEHNTVLHDGPVLEIDGPAVLGFVFRNNFSRHNKYGVKGQNHAVGTDTVNAYFPGAVFTRNVLAGGLAASYPTGNYFPPTAEFTPSFVNPAAGDYTLVATSAYKNKATDGRDIGVDSVRLRLAQSAGSTPTPAPPPDPTPNPSPDPTPDPVVLPEGWQSEDVGAVGRAGSATASGGTFVIKGAGADVWGTVDAFHYAYRTLSGDGTIVARVSSLAGTAAWTKVGVMIRTNTDPGSAYAFMIVSKEKGLAFQRRRSSGASSVHTAAGTGTAPHWVRLARDGNTITAAVSANGTTWTTVGSDTFTMPADVLIGLATHGHDVDEVASGTFDNVSVAAGEVLPDGWTSTDIGVGKAGSAASTMGTLTLKATGGDIWGTADALHLAWTTLSGDGSITARVASVSGSEDWAKAGLMIRQTLDAGSAHASILVTPGKGINFQRRTVTGGTSVSTAGTATAPEWVRLTRNGQLVVAFASADGRTWREIGRDTLSVVGDVHVGLAVSSHSATASATGTFDNVRAAGE